MQHQPVLTDVQRLVLWYRSQGLTCAEVARETSLPENKVRSIYQRILINLVARNPEHAVAIGLLGGHIGPWKDCGTLAAWRRHMEKGETTCAACKRGNADRAALKNLMSRRHSIPMPNIRLLRAIDAGRSNTEICAAWGISKSRLNRLVTDTYRRLGVDKHAPFVRRQEALRHARALGLLGVRPPNTRGASGPGRPAVTLSDVEVKILLELERGATIAGAADNLGMPRPTVSSRISQAYRKLGVTWMDKDVRRQEAIRRARKAGLLPEPAAV